MPKVTQLLSVTLLYLSPKPVPFTSSRPEATPTEVIALTVPFFCQVLAEEGRLILGPQLSHPDET